MKRSFWGSNIALFFGLLMAVPVIHDPSYSSHSYYEWGFKLRYFPRFDPRDYFTIGYDYTVHNWGHLLTGAIMVLGSLAYKSVKKRRLGVAKKFIKGRKYLEIGALIVSALLPFILMRITPLAYILEFLSIDLTTFSPFIALMWVLGVYGDAATKKIE